ncbi:hypothetical protein [Agromyces bauzanensis]
MRPGGEDGSGTSPRFPRSRNGPPHAHPDPPPDSRDDGGRRIRRAAHGLHRGRGRRGVDLTEEWSYGLGTILVDDWVIQTPLFGGDASTIATLPASRADDGRAVAIAVAVTYTPDSFEDWDGALANRANELARGLGAELVPGNPPPAFETPRADPRTRTAPADISPPGPPGSAVSRYAAGSASRFGSFHPGRT